MTQTRYVNSVPEHVPVTVYNNSITIELDDAAVEWVVETFLLADSAGDAGLVFFLSKQVVDPNQVQVFVDNVPQVPGVAFTAAADRITMAAAITVEQVVVRYLAYTAVDTWSTEVFTIADSTSNAGLEFTLGSVPTAGAEHLHVLKNGTLLTLTTDYTQALGVLTLTVALVAGDQLIVTYAHT